MAASVEQIAAEIGAAYHAASLLDDDSEAGRGRGGEAVSLRSYTEQAWKIVEPATPFVDGYHIGAITEHLEAVSKGEIRNLLINIPPRHAKSLLVAVFWPTWEWTKRPELRYLFASYALSLSKRDSLKCRRVIDSDWYQTNFGNVFKLTSDQNEKLRFENDKTGYRLATSVGGAATGEGGDRIVVDDPHKTDEALSDTIREGAISWWKEAMSTRGNDPKTVAKVIVMQRVHERDLSGHVLEEGGWDHLCLPFEYEPKVQICVANLNHDIRTEQGERLSPERYGEKEAEELKRGLGSYGSAGQLQQRPSPAEGGMLKRYWWRYWKPKGSDLPPVMVKQPDGEWKPVEAIELPEQLDEQIQSWDMAFKDEKAAKGGKPDFVVGQVWGRKSANKYFLEQVRDRLDFPDTCSAVKALSASWPKTTAKLVEDKANGPAVISTLKNTITGLIPVEPEGGKIARVNSVSPEIESGNVYLPHPMLKTWVNGFIESSAAFPNAANDDEQDAMSQALRRLSTSREWHTSAPMSVYGG
jgi:predicted phage terminase large subunit-like protein